MGAANYKYYVSNGSGETMFVRAHEDRWMVQYSDGVNIEALIGNAKVSAYAKSEAKNILKEQGFFQLAANDSIEVNGNYISVAGDPEKHQWVSMDFKPPDDRSVIITETPSLLLSKYGKLWKDETGQYHGNKVCPTCGQKKCQH